MTSVRLSSSITELCTTDQTIFSCTNCDFYFLLQRCVLYFPATYHRRRRSSSYTSSSIKCLIIICLDMCNLLHDSVA